MKKSLTENQENHSLENTLRLPKKESLFFDNLITIEKLSENLGLSKKTLHNWVSLRKIPYVKIGRKVYFRSSSLRQWIERKEFKSCL